jgi:hypothetical protein
MMVDPGPGMPGNNVPSVFALDCNVVVEFARNVLGLEKHIYRNGFKNS